MSNTKADKLGTLVSAEVRSNKDGCEVPLTILADAGVAIDTEAYIDWLAQWKLRQLRPSKNAVCFVPQPFIH